jgi:hypothetical protein
MSYGPASVFSGFIASGASTVSMDLARGWKTVYVEVGTMSTATVLGVYAAASAAGGYRQVFHPTINSATVVTNSFVIQTSVAANGGIAPVPAGLRYMQFRTTAVVSGGVSIAVHCSD